MLRAILALLLLALLGLALFSRLRSTGPDPVGVAQVEGGAAALPPPADHPTKAPLAVPAFRPLDSLVRSTARLRLASEPDRQYLDSLLSATDSTLRRWPDDGNLRGFAILPGGSRDYVPELAQDVRWAIEQWDAAVTGIRFLERADTAGAELIVRWVDSLDGIRAGSTDISWDQTGRIRHVEITLATRFRHTGQQLAPQARRAIVLHEVGHALGLPHSPRANDVMFPIATDIHPTDRDRFSLLLLYQLPSGWVGAGPPVWAP